MFSLRKCIQNFRTIPYSLNAFLYIFKKLNLQEAGSLELNLQGSRRVGSRAQIDSPIVQHIS